MGKSAEPPEQSASEWIKTIARKGGKARAKKLTKEQRQEIARKAAKARWNGNGKK